MNKKALIETNPYLKEPEKYRRALITNVSTSTAIETGAPSDSIARALTERAKPKRVKRARGSGR